MTTTLFPNLQLIGSGAGFMDIMCSMLETTQMFRDFEWHEIQQLSNYLEAYRADQGVTLFREGDQGDYMCVIIEGRVDILKEDSHEALKVVDTVGAGKTLGEMALIDGQARSAAAVAAQTCTLAILTKANFQRITREKPGLANKILLKIAVLLSQRLRHTSGILVDYLEQ